MSEYDEHDDDVEAGDPAGLRKRAEKALKRATEAEARAAAAERELMFANAGIPADGAGKYFRKGYDGELTLEAIKAEAESAGLFTAKASAEAEEPEVPAEELAALDAMRRTQAGGIPPDSGDPAQALRARMEAVADGPGASEAIAAMLREAGLPVT
jgi:hypothetical protein